MKVIVAIDSFKGSLSSMAAGETAANAIKKVIPNVNVKIYPLADGGEGTVAALTEGLGGDIVTVRVTGPLGRKVDGLYGSVNDTAIIEMANAAGLTLVPIGQENPLNTTTYGLGELIIKAAEDGCREFIIGIGGSATNDCGLGMLTALGFEFRDNKGFKVGVFGRDLEHISEIDTSKVNPIIKECRFKIACDVNNPLTGNNGCSLVYGPQKGATLEIASDMDKWIGNFAELAIKTLDVEVASVEGDGAAGGLGFAFRTFLNGELIKGVDLVLDLIGIADELAEANLKNTLNISQEIEKRRELEQKLAARIQEAKEYADNIRSAVNAILEEAIQRLEVSDEREAFVRNEEQEQLQTQSNELAGAILQTLITGYRAREKIKARIRVMEQALVDAGVLDESDIPPMTDTEIDGMLEDIFSGNTSGETVEADDEEEAEFLEDIHNIFNP